MRYPSAFLALLAFLASTLGASVGCIHPAPSLPSAVAPTLAGDPAHPGRAQNWVDTRLYFGLGPANDSAKGVSESAWGQFLDKEVTPRFPDGLSVLNVYGQWQSKGSSTPERIRTKLLVIDYQDSPDNRAKIDAIRAAWKLKTGDQSVMRVTEPADVSF